MKCLVILFIFILLDFCRKVPLCNHIGVIILYTLGFRRKVNCVVCSLCSECLE